MMIELDVKLKRLNLPTVRRLWSDLQVRAEKEGMRYADYLETLVSEEIAHRGETRVQRMVRKAHFPFLRTIEEFDFTYQTGLRKELLGSYLGPEFIREGRCLICFGPSGCGKTHVGVAIAYRAIQNGSDARFVTAAELIEDLTVASREGRLRERLSEYTHPGVLVVDEVGYLSLGPEAANVFFQVVNHRYLRKKPMVFTTNKPVEDWGRVLHDPDLAEAILDRVLERGRVVRFKGPSYRTRHLEGKDVPIVSRKTTAELCEPTHLAKVVQRHPLRSLAEIFQGTETEIVSLPPPQPPSKRAGPYTQISGNPGYIFTRVTAIPSLADCQLLIDPFSGRAHAAQQERGTS
jgi:DNA replication protein DnaC